MIVVERKYVLDQVLAVAKVIAPNAKYAVGIDWTVNANEHRFFLIDTQQQKIIYSWWTSHGSGSGTLVKAVDFSNVNGSNKSSKGHMKTAETYSSNKFGYALRLDGLDPGVNDNIRSRDIVMHPSNYVTENYVSTNKYPGRSHGCITLDPKTHDDIIDRLKGGSAIINITSI